VTHPGEPQTKSKKMFLIETRRLAASVDGLSTSLAIVAGELWPKKCRPLQWPARAYLYAFLTCRKASCIMHEATHHHHWHIFCLVMWLLTLRAPTSLRSKFFLCLFTLHRHCSYWLQKLACSKLTPLYFYAWWWWY